MKITSKEMRLIRHNNLAVSDATQEKIDLIVSTVREHLVRLTALHGVEHREDCKFIAIARTFVATGTRLQYIEEIVALDSNIA